MQGLAKRPENVHHELCIMYQEPSRREGAGYTIVLDSAVVVLDGCPGYTKEQIKEPTKRSV